MGLPAIQWGLIAGIFDHGGGSRVIMSTNPFSPAANTMWHKGERAFLASGMWSMSREPLENDPAWIVWWGDKARLDATRGHCGACRACCITPFIADEGDGFTKPSHRPCHNLCNEGCRIQTTKPRACRDFACLWRASQDGNRPMDPELRPDRCGTMMTRDPDDTVRLHNDSTYPKSEVVQTFIIEREKDGERFRNVSSYYGET